MTTKIGISLSCILLTASFQAFNPIVPKIQEKSFFQNKSFFDAVREGDINRVACYVNPSYFTIGIPEVKLALLMAVNKNHKEITKMLFDRLIQMSSIKDPSQLLDKIYEKLSAHKHQDFERIRSYILPLYENIITTPVVTLVGENLPTTVNTPPSSPAIAFTGGQILNRNQQIFNPTATIYGNPGLDGTPGPQELSGNSVPDDTPGDQGPAGAPGFTRGFGNAILVDQTYGTAGCIRNSINSPCMTISVGLNIPIYGDVYENTKLKLFFDVVREGYSHLVVSCLHPRYLAIDIPNIKLAINIAIEKDHKEITKILFDHLIKNNGIKEPSQLLDKIYEELSVHQPQEFERIRRYILALYENIITTPVVTPLVDENLPTTVNTPPNSPTAAFGSGQSR